MTAPAKILELVERFDRNIDAYKQGKYNEAQVRKEFIDPFFKELGWDVDNEKGYAEAYKDVVHEDAIRVGRATKAPDYSFRIGGSRKFFLEAKNLRFTSSRIFTRLTSCGAMPGAPVCPLACSSWFDFSFRHQLFS